MLDSTARASRPMLTVVVLCLGGMTVSLTQTLVIPIQYQLPTLLQTDPSNSAWVVTVTLLAAAVTMVVGGRIADLVGKQPVLVGSAAMLAAGSLVCAMSDSLAPVLAGRAMQGLAMGFIPVGISLMREVTPPELTGTGVAAMSATLGVGGAIGLPFSAWIVEIGDWHTLFWVSAALALVILALVALLVPNTHDAHPGRLDAGGAVGLAVGLLAFLIGISKATDWGWGSGRTLGAIVGGLVVLVLWGRYELRHPEPLVDLRATARLPVLMTNLAAIAVGFGMMAQSIVIPQLLQLPEQTGYGLGQSILAAGLWMAPGGLMMLVFAPVSSGLISRAGARTTLMVGAVVLAAGYGLATVLMDAPWQLLIASCVAAAGVGIGYAAMPTLVLDATEPRRAGAAVGFNALMRSTGTTLAAAVMGTLLASSTRTVTIGGQQQPIPTEGAFVVCFAIGAVAALLGAALIAVVPRDRAAQPDAQPVAVD